uniref:Uncharacterized protein n=1 Tax=Anguilla anguilla TaxID=7936 RepID=A0A0E9U9D3_ANGAN
MGFTAPSWLLYYFPFMSRKFKRYPMQLQCR